MLHFVISSQLSHTHLQRNPNSCRLGKFRDFEFDNFCKFQLITVLFELFDAENT